MSETLIERVAYEMYRQEVIGNEGRLRDSAIVKRWRAARERDSETSNDIANDVINALCEMHIDTLNDLINERCRRLFQDEVA